MNKRASSEPQTLAKGNKNWKVLPKGTGSKTIITEVKKAKRAYIKTKKKTLTRRELKFVNAKVNGKSNLQAAKEATGTKSDASAGVTGHRLSKEPTIQEAIAHELKRQGISLDVVIKPIADGLDAERDVYNKDGEWMASSPDHSIRLKSSGMALDLMGARNRDAGGVTVNFVQVAQSERGQFFNADPQI